MSVDGYVDSSGATGAPRRCSVVSLEGAPPQRVVAVGVGRGWTSADGGGSGGGATDWGSSQGVVVIAI